MEEFQFKLRKIIIPYFFVAITSTISYCIFYIYVVKKYDLISIIESKYLMTESLQMTVLSIIFCLPCYLLMKPRIGFLENNIHHSRITMAISSLLVFLFLGCLLYIDIYPSAQETVMSDEFKVITLTYLFLLVLFLSSIFHADLKEGAFKNKKRKTDHIIQKIAFAYRLAWRIGFYMLSAVLFVFLFLTGFVAIMQTYEAQGLSFELWGAIPLAMSGAFLYVLLKGHKLPLNFNNSGINASSLSTHKTYTFNDFDRLIDAISKQNNNGSFLVLMFGGNELEEDLNIQLSIENGILGIDWVLMTQSNIQDKNLFIDASNKLNFNYQKRTNNGIDYFRIEKLNNFSSSIKALLKEMYNVNDQAIFDTVIEGFNIDT